MRKDYDEPTMAEQPDKTTTVLDRKRPVPILTRDNYEQWFKLMKLYLQKEKIWKIVEKGDITEDDFESDNANALYTLAISIGIVDEELTKGII